MSLYFVEAVAMTVAVGAVAVGSYRRQSAFRRRQVASYGQWRSTGESVPGWDQRWIWSRPAARSEMPPWDERGAA